MSSLVFLVPISLVLLGVAIWAFVWAVRRGQFDDLETPAIQILVDEPGTRSADTGAESGDATGTGAEASPDTAAREADEPRPPRAG